MFSYDRIGISGDHPHESAPQQVLGCHGCSEHVTTRGVGSRPTGAGASAEAFAVDFVLHRNYHSSTEAGIFVSVLAAGKRRIRSNPLVQLIELPEIRRYRGPGNCLDTRQAKFRKSL